MSHFEYFTKLPLELRQKIWRLALEPRVVEVFVSEDVEIRFWTRAKLPALFYVCKDAQQAVNSLYHSYFGSRLLPTRIRFYPTLDTLFLSTCTEDTLAQISTILKPSELDSIRFLAVVENVIGYNSSNEGPPGDFRYVHPKRQLIRKMVSKMTNLDRVQLTNDISCYRNEELAKVDTMENIPDDTGRALAQAFEDLKKVMDKKLQWRQVWFCTREELAALASRDRPLGYPGERKHYAFLVSQRYQYLGIPNVIENEHVIEIEEVIVWRGGESCREI